MAAGCVDDIVDVGPDDVAAGDLGAAAGLRGRVGTVVNLHGRGPVSHRWLEGLDAEVRLGHAAPGWEGPDWREGLHERERWVRLLAHAGIAADPDDLRIDPERLPVENAGERAGATAVVHVGAAHRSRHWPCSRFAEVARDLLGRGFEVVLTGNGAEVERARTVAEAVAAGAGHLGARVRLAAGTQSLSEFAATIAHAGVLVSADTGAAHLASAFATPSVVIFGPVSPRVWGPPAGPHRVLFDEPRSGGDPFADSPDPALLSVTSADVTCALDALGI